MYGIRLHLPIITFFSLCLVWPIYADNCAVHFYGASHVALSAQSPNVFGDLPNLQHAFDLWVNPDRFVSYEQGLFQTGIVRSAQGAWAVELKLKLTIWQQGHAKPTAGVLYADVWHMNSTETVGIWHKTRYYVILGEYHFPWVHVVFTPITNGGSVGMNINGKNVRPDKYSPIMSSDIHPSRDFAIGKSFHGAIDELKIQSTADLFSDVSPCSSDDSNTNFVFYLPFDECGGVVFSGYNHGRVICTLMDGTYGAPELVVDSVTRGTQYDPVWSNDSPAPTYGCPATLSVCVNATVKSYPDAHKKIGDENDKEFPPLITPLRTNTVYVALFLCLIALAAIVTIVRNKKTDTSYVVVSTNC